MPDILFLADSPFAPTEHAVHRQALSLAHALAARGVSVGLAARPATHPGAAAAATPDELRLPWPEASARDEGAFLAGWAGPLASRRDRFADRRGFDPRAAAGVLPLLRDAEPKAVIGVGPEAPLLLRGLRACFPQTLAVWLAGDEPAAPEFARFLRDADEPAARAAAARRLRDALAVHALFARGLDGVLGATPRQTARLARFTGAPNAATLRVGCDLDAPALNATDPTPRSALFFGPLDHEPHARAAVWFVERVWTRLRRAFPDATLRVAGRAAPAEVLEFQGYEGVEVLDHAGDPRPLARRAAAVVLPHRSPVGVESTLPQAAALGLPIAASWHAVDGQELGGHQPALLCRSTDEWVAALTGLWNRPELRRDLAREARAWAEARHPWSRHADTLLAALNSWSRTGRRIGAHRKPVALRKAA